MFPVRREEELVVRHLPDETLIYDLKRNKAHCLNSAAGLVWRHCDGQTSLSQLAKMLREELDIPAGEQVARLALDRLQKAKLLQPVAVAAEGPRYSRREMAKLGGAAVAASLVTTILARPAYAQASCVAQPTCIGQGCACNPGDHCCPGFQCTGVGNFKTCR
jgi:hypothetical protein